MTTHKQKIEFWIDDYVHVESFVRGGKIHRGLDEVDVPDNFNEPLGLLPGEYVFTYVYPLTHSAEFKHRLTASTTAIDIIELAAADYKLIYKEEDETSAKKAGPISPNMLNRNITTGKHGIWGHDLGDLGFQGFDVNGYDVDFHVCS